MSGYENYNYESFHAAAEHLRSCGHTVFNPAESFDGNQGLPKTTYMKADLAWITSTAEAVVVLPGWKGSKGANLEVACASGIGLPVLSYPELQPVGVSTEYRHIFVDDNPVPCPRTEDRAPVGANTPAEPLKRSLVDGVINRLTKEQPLAQEKWAPRVKDYLEQHGVAVCNADPVHCVGTTPAADVRPGLLDVKPAPAPSQNAKLSSGEVRITDPKTGGQKGSKPERYDLIPVAPLAELARVYGYGSRKYADRNWEKGYKWSLCYAALVRHLQAFWERKDIDDESGLHHCAHVAWHALALMEFSKKGKGTDDRAE